MLVSYSLQFGLSNQLKQIIIELLMWHLVSNCWFDFLNNFNFFTAARTRVAANERAEAEKIIQIKRAEGEAESRYLSGVGIARQRQAIVDGLRDSVLGFSVNVPGTTAKDVLDMVLITQYFDTMKEIGASSKSSSVFIPHGPGAVRDIATQIRDGLLQASHHQE